MTILWCVIVGVLPFFPGCVLHMVMLYTHTIWSILSDCYLFRLMLVSFLWMINSGWIDINWFTLDLCALQIGWSTHVGVQRLPNNRCETSTVGSSSGRRLFQKYCFNIFFPARYEHFWSLLHQFSPLFFFLALSWLPERNIHRSCSVALNQVLQ